MKYHEFYRKYKTRYPPLRNLLFSRRNWRSVVLITVVAMLIESLIIYGRQRSVPFDLYNYFKLFEYLSFMAVPFTAFLFWVNWRESIKRSRGYGWVGKFEVIGKRSSFIRWYLLLEPGNHHKLKVDRSLFEKTRIGDFILIRRDVFGNIEEVSKFKNLSRGLARTKS